MTAPSQAFTANQVPQLAGKTALVTGANTGLGFETAKVLAQRGATVYVACRSPGKAEAAIEAILEDTPSASVHFVALDLGNLESVRAAAASLAELPSLDLLINNAGIMTPPFSLTEDGFECQFGVNHLGPFAFTGLLLDKLVNTSGARIVNTSSLAARRGNILFDDPHAEQGYDAMVRYSMSKLANLMFAVELDRRLKLAGAQCISVACHPGVADTELSRYFPRWFMLAQPVLKRLFNTPAQGAWPTLQAATDAGVEGGDYFGPTRAMQTSGPSRKVGYKEMDQVALTRLWRVSEELTGVKYF